MAERIFILEDHASFRRTLKLIVEAEEGFSVCCTSGSGEDALREIPETNPTLALIDLSLPGMSGMDVLKAMKPLFPDLRIVMLSGHHQKHYALEALESGASAYVVKGNPPDILEALHCASRGETYMSPGLR